MISRPVRLILSALFLLTACISLVGCGDDDQPIPPTLDPDPPFTQQQAIELAKASLSEVVAEIEFEGYEQVRIRVGLMRLRRLQELTKSDLYSPDSPRMLRQIWAVQIGGTFPDDPDPYRVPYGYGIVGIDAQNGDIWLRARYDQEILVE